MCHRVEVKKGSHQMKNFASLYHIVTDSGVRFADFVYESEDPSNPNSKLSSIMDIECEDYVWNRVCNKLHGRFGYANDQVEILE